MLPPGFISAWSGMKFHVVCTGISSMRPEMKTIVPVTNNSRIFCDRSSQTMERSPCDVSHMNSKSQKRTISGSLASLHSFLPRKTRRETKSKRHTANPSSGAGTKKQTQNFATRSSFHFWLKKRTFFRQGELSHELHACGCSNGGRQPETVNLCGRMILKAVCVNFCSSASLVKNHGVNLSQVLRRAT